MTFLLLIILVGSYLFHEFVQSRKENYKYGIMSLVSSNLMYNIKVKYAHNMLFQFVIYGLILMFLFYLPAVVVSTYFEKIAVMEELDFATRVVWAAVVTYIICGFMIYAFDLDTLECCFRRYKKSSYYLATKEERKGIAGNDGLIGEYKGYVLSRTLNVPHKVLHNVCIPMRNGNFQEVDTIIITRNIIYVVECKNRVGKFVGEFEDKEWIQRIGKKENVEKNIYMQNQHHTMALDQFLLDRGIIQNGQNVCMNVLLTTGRMTLSIKGTPPLDFVVGNARKVRKFIESKDKVFDDGTDTSGIMNQIYEALLPYALYTKAERSMMMEERRIRSLSKEFAVGEFQTRYIDSSVTSIAKLGESTELRSNRLYTQVKIQSGKRYCWQTRTDIGNQMKVNLNPCSKGVERERVEAFKKALGDDPKLVLKKMVWIVFGVCLVILICAASMS